MAKRPKKPKKPKKPNPTATPEPATWLLIGSGAAGIALIRKRFKK